MRWIFISSTAIWVTGSDTGSVASRARTELTSSKCDWTRIWATYLECRWNNLICMYFATWHYLTPSPLEPSYIYSISKWKRQSISLFFSNEKFKKQILFFYLHFTWLCGSWKFQRILKKYWFWKCESWFPFEVAKLTSANYPLKWCIFSHDFYHFNQYFLI